MKIPSDLRNYHAAQASEARRLYVESLTTAVATEDWHRAKVESRKQVFRALKASDILRDIPGALSQSGSHLAIYRHLLAPPMSQDQFSLLCPEYPKRNEKNGTALNPVASDAVAKAILDGRDRTITEWLSSGNQPTVTQIRNLVRSVVPLLSLQIAATLRRNRLSAQQEGAVVDLLSGKGWTRQGSTLIATLDTVQRRHFMHKARFATKTRPQEVDIACGLGNTTVLAMECKVTNDETNSIKRINDVLKKAAAWHDHWGSFVRTAALLQGAIAIKDVERLLEAKVHVFWSHDLTAFEAWLEHELA